MLGLQIECPVRDRGSAAEAEEGDDHHEAPGAEDEDVHDLIQTGRA